LSFLSPLSLIFPVPFLLFFFVFRYFFLFI